MRNLTLSDVDRLRLEAGEAEVVFEMDEEAFRAFYDRTARALWGYLSRVSGDAQLADDLLQEAYYRFLRARGRWQSERHRRNYLYRIATNLVRDRHRRAAVAQIVPLDDDAAGPEDGRSAARVDERTDLRRAMAHLKPRERQILWLAYAQGSSHREIAESIGVKAASVKLMLFRARRRLADLLRGGPGPSRETHT